MPGERLFKSTSNLMVAQILGAGLAFVSEITLSRFAGAEGRGAYGLIFAATQLGMGVGSFVLGLVAVREVRQGKLSVRSAIKVSTLGSLPTATIAGILAVVLLGGFYSPMIPWKIASLAILVIIPMSIATNARQILIGLADSRNAAYSHLFERIGLISLFLLGFVALTSSWEYAAWALALNSILTAVVTIKFMRSHWLSGGREARAESVLSVLKRLSHSSWRILFGNVAQFANYRLDLFLLAYWIGSRETGVYAAAVALSSGLWYITDAASRALYPVACDEATLGSAPIRTLRTARIVFLGTAILGVLSIPLATLAIPILLGPGFNDARLLFCLLMPGVIAFGATKLFSTVLISRGREGNSSAVAAAAAAVTLVGDILLIPSFGAVGAAVASSVAYIVSAALTLAIVSKDVKLSLSQLLRANESRRHRKIA
jgi:O-antigen/teichoic acid export membrane protein